MEKKSYPVILMAFAIAMLMMPIAESLAQGGRGRGGRGDFGGRGGQRGVSAANLLRIDEVKAELEITDEQIEAIKTAMEELRGDRGEDRERVNFRDMSEEERNEYMEKVRSQAEAQAKKAKEKLGDILLPHQMERLEQIAIQAQGVAALRSKDVAAKLGLSEDQVASIRKSMDEAMQGIREQMREMFQGGGRGGDMQAVREKMQELRKEVEEKALANLSDDQKKKFEALKGEKFEMPERAAFGGRGRGGRRGDRPDRPDRPQRPEVE